METSFASVPSYTCESIDSLDPYNIDSPLGYFDMLPPQYSQLDSLLTKRRCAADVGGTLAKLVYVIPTPPDDDEEETSPVPVSNTGEVAVDSSPQSEWAEDYHPYSPLQRADTDGSNLKDKLRQLVIKVSPEKSLAFEYFSSKNIEELQRFIRENKLVDGEETLNITGGGAYKYAEKIANECNIALKKRDEMLSVMRGLQFLLSLPNSVFRYDITLKKRIPVSLGQEIYPFLVVNIGSGVSILKASGPDAFMRATGTCVGGGTVLGLARLIFGAQSFHEVVTLSEKGNPTLDLTINDLFGDAAEGHSLPPDTLASSFGRVYHMPSGLKGSDLRSKLKKADIARSLIHMVSYNLGYLAYLVGSIHNVRRIFFAGKYIDNQAFTMESITHGVNFYTTQYSHHSQMNLVKEDFKMEKKLNVSRGDEDTEALTEASSHRNDIENESDTTPLGPPRTEKHATTSQDKPFEVLFLKHDGYLGALGSLLAPEDDGVQTGFLPSK